MSNPELDLMRLITASMRSRLKVSVFDDTGRLLWFSPDWMSAGGPMANPAEPLGLKWLDFVHPDDAARCLAWATSDEEGAEVQFRAHSANARNVWLACILIKHRAGNYWIATGENRPL